MVFKGLPGSAPRESDPLSPGTEFDAHSGRSRDHTLKTSLEKDMTPLLGGSQTLCLLEQVNDKRFSFPRTLGDAVSHMWCVPGGVPG